MTEHDRDPETPNKSGAQTSSTRLASWWPVLAPAVALVVGLLIGGVVVAVANNGDASSAQEGPAGTPSADEATESASSAPTTVVVPAECLAAVDTVDQLTRLTREAVGAVRDFRPAELRGLLTDLEKLDGQARRQAKACRAVKVQTSEQ